MGWDFGDLDWGFCLFVWVCFYCNLLTLIELNDLEGLCQPK